MQGDYRMPCLACQNKGNVYPVRRSSYPSTGFQNNIKPNHLYTRNERQKTWLLVITINGRAITCRRMDTNLKPVRVQGHQIPELYITLRIHRARLTIGFIGQIQVPLLLSHIAPCPGTGTFQPNIHIQLPQTERSITIQ